jgi:YHS domain-containing protein
VLFRGLLFYVMLFFIARAVWRLLQGIIQGASSSSGTRAAAGRQRASPPVMKLTRDPVCGTFVVPGKAVEFVRGRETLYFCSDACRRRFLEKA